MLVTLADVKAYLGITANTFDAFLTEQISILSETIENYCGRKFLSASYVQKFYSNDYSVPQKEIPLYHFPVTAVAAVIEDSVTLDPTAYRNHTPTGILKRENDYFFRNCTDILEVQYTAGFSILPLPIRQVIYNLCEEKYNKKKSGVALNFGSDVQRISIPGTISIDFDYTLTTNDRKNSFGTILGSHLNILDYYRSERSLGSGSISYVT